jgi:hypothetical protein
MPAYATADEFADYVPGWVTDDAPALDRLLEDATRDVDAILGPLPVLELGDYAGFKLDPSTLRPWEAEALSRATCAQTLHRYRNPPEDVDQARPTRSISGPDFAETYGDVAIDGRAPSGRYSPRVALELKPIGHLRRLGGYVRG